MYILNTKVCNNVAHNFSFISLFVNYMSWNLLIKIKHIIERFHF